MAIKDMKDILGKEFLNWIIILRQEEELLIYKKEK